MSGVQEKSLSRRFHCMSYSEVSPGTSGILSEEGAVMDLSSCWFRAGSLLAGDENHLTVYKCPGFCESSNVLKTIRLCVMSCKDALNFSHAPGMARRVGQLVNWAVKRPVAPTVPHVMSGSPPGSISHDFCHIQLCTCARVPTGG